MLFSLCLRFPGWFPRTALGFFWPRSASHVSSDMANNALQKMLGYELTSPLGSPPSTPQKTPPPASDTGHSSSPDIPLISITSRRQPVLHAATQSAIAKPMSPAKRKATQPLDAPSPPKRIKQSSEDPSETDPPKPRRVPFPEKPAVIEERNGEIEFRVVNNDGRRDSTIILTGLKCIFQKQLPKMPKDYIARLVYDRTHMSIAIVKKPLEVVGWVTSGPFSSRTCLLSIWQQWYNLSTI